MRDTGFLKRIANNPLTPHIIYNNGFNEGFFELGYEHHTGTSTLEKNEDHLKIIFERAESGAGEAVMQTRQKVNFANIDYVVIHGKIGGQGYPGVFLSAGKGERTYNNPGGILLYDGIEDEGFSTEENNSIKFNVQHISDDLYLNVGVNRELNDVPNEFLVYSIYGGIFTEKEKAEIHGLVSGFQKVIYNEGYIEEKYDFSISRLHDLSHVVQEGFSKEVDHLRLFSETTGDGGSETLFASDELIPFNKISRIDVDFEFQGVEGYIGLSKIRETRLSGASFTSKDRILLDSFTSTDRQIRELDVGNIAGEYYLIFSVRTGSSANLSELKTYSIQALKGSGDSNLKAFDPETNTYKDLTAILAPDGTYSLSVVDSAPWAYDPVNEKMKVRDTEAHEKFDQMISLLEQIRDNTAS